MVQNLHVGYIRQLCLKWQTVKSPSKATRRTLAILDRLELETTGLRHSYYF